MSYIDVREEVFDLLSEWKQQGRRWKDVLDVLPEAQRAMVQRRIAEGRLGGLVAWAIENFDTNCGDHCIWPLSKALEKAGDKQGLQRLWSGIIANRVGHCRQLTSDAEAQRLDAEDQERRQGAINAMSEHLAALERMNDVNLAERARDRLALFRAGKKRRKPKRKPDRRKMDDDVFWELIEESRPGVSNSTEHATQLTEKLEAFQLRQIVNFHKILQEKITQLYSHDLWAVAYIVRNGCSDDAFEYFRAWVILQGKTAHESTLGDPEGIAPYIADNDPQCEPLLYVADEAYENKKGEPLKLKPTATPALSGTPWDVSDLPGRFPELCARFSFSPE